MVTRYTAGEAIRALSREYGISRSGLRQLLQNAKVVLREQGITPENVELAVQFYRQGMTLVQVAEQVGSSYGALRKALHEQGVALRAPGRGRRVISRGCPSATLETDVDASEGPARR